MVHQYRWLFKNMGYSCGSLRKTILGAFIVPVVYHKKSLKQTTKSENMVAINVSLWSLPTKCSIIQNNCQKTDIKNKVIDNFGT